jgi:nucleoside-diphosphate-sugar epimerase
MTQKQPSEIVGIAPAARPARILVWGALGMIGSHLTEALVRADCSVMVLCRSRSAYPEPWWASRVEWHELEKWRAEETLQRAVSRASIIINLAGASGAVASNLRPIESLDQNCRIQLQFLEACRAAGHKPHVVFTSSRLVYGSPERLPVPEGHPLCPRSMYAAHKLCIEQYLQIYAGMNAITFTVCRISNAYGYDSIGASKGYKILNSFIERSLAGKSITLFGTGEQTRDFIHIEDLTTVLIRCCVLSATINQTMNVGSGESCRLVDAAGIIREMTGGPPLCFEPWPEEYLTVESGDYVTDIGNMIRLLEFAPRYSIRSGIAQTIQSYLRGRATKSGATLTDTPLALA